MIASEIFPQHVRDKAFGLSALGQITFLLALTQPWPRFTEKVGPRSYWLPFGLNVLAMVSYCDVNDSLLLTTQTDLGDFRSPRNERNIA